MDLTLTAKQIRVLRYFRDYRTDRGISPTLEEAAVALGVSKITIFEHLNQLAAKGAIHRDRAKARSVSILYDPDAGQNPEARTSVPILGAIAAVAFCYFVLGGSEANPAAWAIYSVAFVAIVYSSDCRPPGSPGALSLSRPEASRRVD